MKPITQNITFIKLETGDHLPYELLLLADPSKDLVDDYVRRADVFIARFEEETIGVVVLLELTEEAVEIKNIAVKPEFQGRGVGGLLMDGALKAAKLNGYSKAIIGTANSSVGQLYLYQKLGFELTEIKRDYFVEHYPEPIYENGIQAKHLLLLTKRL